MSRQRVSYRLLTQINQRRVRSELSKQLLPPTHTFARALLIDFSRAPAGGATRGCFASAAVCAARPPCPHSARDRRVASNPRFSPPNLLFSGRSCYLVRAHANDFDIFSIFLYLVTATEPLDYNTLSCRTVCRTEEAACRMETRSRCTCC